MAQEVILKVTARSAKGSKAVRRLRSEGMIPGIVYGEGKENVLVQVNPEVLDKLLHEGHRVVSLQLADGEQLAIIKDVQYDAIGEAIVHVDFGRIEAGHAVTVMVPIELHGTAPGVKEGGNIEFTQHEVHVSCVPSAIPQGIRVEIGELGIDQVIRVGDIQSPEGVTIMDNPDVPIVSVRLPRGEEVEEAIEGEAPAEPELVGREEKEETEESS